MTARASPNHQPEMPVSAQQTLVIGIGNEFAHDDAVGLLVARQVAQRVPTATVLEQRGEATDLIAAWAGVQRVVLIDAISSGAPAGTVHRFEVGSRPLAVDLFSASSHTLGVAQAIELARVLGALPRRLTLFGIEGADFSPGAGLSAAVASAVCALAHQIQAELSA